MYAIFVPFLQDHTFWKCPSTLFPIKQMENVSHGRRKLENPWKTKRDSSKPFSKHNWVLSEKEESVINYLFIGGGQGWAEGSIVLNTMNKRRQNVWSLWIRQVSMRRGNLSKDLKEEKTWTMQIPGEVIQVQWKSQCADPKADICLPHLRLVDLKWNEQ